MFPGLLQKEEKEHGKKKIYYFLKKKNIILFSRELAKKNVTDVINQHYYNTLARSDLLILVFISFLLPEFLVVGSDPIHICGKILQFKQTGHAAHQLHVTTSRSGVPSATVYMSGNSSSANYSNYFLSYRYHVEWCRRSTRFYSSFLTIYRFKSDQL